MASRTQRSKNMSRRFASSTMHLSLFFKQCTIKQLLDPVFVISGIIKVSLSVNNLRLADQADHAYLDLD